MRCVIGIEYVARITEEDYRVFKMILSLRVREWGKRRAYSERGATCVEIEISPEEFSAYCKAFKRPDFGIFSLDQCARAKGLAQSNPRRSRENTS